MSDEQLEHTLARLQLDSQPVPLHYSGSGSLAQQSISDSPKKKLAPTVPPKPKKAQPQAPLVPKSYSIKPPQEPSFSTVLQNKYSRAPPDSSNYSNASNYSNVANYSNSSSYSNASNYSNMTSYSNAPNYSNMTSYSNAPNYSNMTNYIELDDLNSAASVTASTVGRQEDDDLSPPPPPEPENYSPPVNPSFPPPPEDLPPPPSPVSSSYSELRRATNQPQVYNASPQGYPQNYNQNYGTYSPSSQSSSTYESIYEPINPRPPSQMSSRSNYSLYSPYASSKTQGIASGQSNQSLTSPDKYGQEAQVDALTDLLVQSMNSSGDPDFFGICTACGEKVVGEGSGCTAMDQVYHIQCFTCYMCQIQLQGKPFYALDGKPYCEEDYLNTLEKCCVCMSPILDRILRATGKPYHPQCFCCVVCGKSLDGIPFTVDATNQIHCIEDFHKKFAPRCSVCQLPIMPEAGQDETVRVVALDKSFHVKCYKCEDCGLVLSSETEGRGCYPLDDHVLCKSCNARRVQALTSRMTTEL